MQPLIISASILAADFSILGKEVTDVLDAGAKAIHFDVMDHQFVPNLSFGAPICVSLRKAGVKAFIGAHLMVVTPENLIDEFAKAGADMFTFHPETTADLDKTIDLVLASGMQAGLAFNPDKPVNITPTQLKKISKILIMSVFPGFGGQKFIPDILDKIKTTRALIEEHNPKCRLGVDGGIKVNTIGDAAKAGADYFVVGSGLFGADDYPERIRQLSAVF
ncbi:MAG: ribulose-phosphate 3-epimerase [Coxiella sp. (in: Bacteria)]|nr:MAG: ribulose-phosphate 3-epimerase [Coxiella sp. (in: g-proteobacteria)]